MDPLIIKLGTWLIISLILTLGLIQIGIQIIVTNLAPFNEPPYKKSRKKT